MSNQYHTKNGRTSKRGAFMNGVWHCDCEPRMPADKFQTKNGGKNHGRWFYTCQKPQPKRCSFFLWSDDAKIREASAVLNNSRSEPSAAQTPRKPAANMMPPTPQTRPRTPPRTIDLTYEPQSDKTIDFDHEDSYDWSPSNDDELAEVTKDFETPRKAVKTTTLDSPSKRKYNEFSEAKNPPSLLPPVDDDVFATPSTSKKHPHPGLLSPGITPSTTTTNQPLLKPDLSHSSLVTEVLDLLQTHHHRLQSDAQTQLIDILTKHDLRTQGIIKGREISRLAVQAKEKKITELQARIQGLEAEKEMNKTVIAHLKMDIATSPRRGGRGGAAGGGENTGGMRRMSVSRSEV